MLLPSRHRRCTHRTLELGSLRARYQPVALLAALLGANVSCGQAETGGGLGGGSAPGSVAGAGGEAGRQAGGRDGAGASSSSGGVGSMSSGGGVAGTEASASAGTGTIGGTSGTNNVTTKLYEAESAVPLAGAKIYEDPAASGGGGMAYLNQEGDGFEFQATDSAVLLTLRYATDRDSSLSLYVSGVKRAVILLPSTRGFSGSYNLVAAAVSIEKGDTVVVRRDAGDDSANVDSVVLSSDTSRITEAESAHPLGGVEAYSDSAAIGGAGLAYLNQLGDGFALKAPGKGNQLSLRYATDSERSLSVFVNGRKAGVLGLRATGGYVGSYTVATLPVELEQGDEVAVRRDDGDGAVNVDDVVVIDNPNPNPNLDSVACAVKRPLFDGTSKCSNSFGFLPNGVASSVWLSDSTTGTNCGDFYNVGAAFKARWGLNSGGDFLARAGLQWDETKTHDQLGTVSADYAFTKSTTDATAFIGVYGWSSSPLVEYYIVEEWLGWNPASNAEYKGTFGVDGGTYDIYLHIQVNQPSIQGTQTFPQFFSIRTAPRECGHISISEHFREWSRVGLNLGKMYESKLLVEAMGGSGTVDFSHAVVSAK